MTNRAPSDGGDNRNRRREAARVKARQLREAQKRRDKRNRALVQGGIGVAVLAALAIVAVIIVGSIRPPTSGPQNMASDGIVIGQGLKAVQTGSLAPDAAPVASTPDPTGNVVSIRLYVDYLCPYCGQFEKANGDQLAAMAKAGAATVEIHPIAILTGHSAGTKYSLRAANAAACVADKSPNHFYAFHSLLFKDEPAESTAGLTDEQIEKYADAAGASPMSAVRKCIDDGRYEPWVQAATDRAIAGPIPHTAMKPPKLTTTPLVLVNGKQYKGSITDPAEFKAFVLQASGETYQKSTSKTDTPTPTATSTSSATPTP
jgi:protein-disulfide isomerase